jgi:hypothetical protein
MAGEIKNRVVLVPASDAAAGSGGTVNVAGTNIKPAKSGGCC